MNSYDWSISLLLPFIIMGYWLKTQTASPEAAARSNNAGARNWLALRINYYAIGGLAKGYRADTEPEGQCQQNIL